YSRRSPGGVLHEAHPSAIRRKPSLILPGNRHNFARKYDRERRHLLLLPVSSCAAITTPPRAGPYEGILVNDHRFTSKPRPRYDESDLGLAERSLCRRRTISDSR